MAENTTQNPQQDAQNGQMAIQKIYVKDVSFEAPHAPQIFAEQTQPKVNMDLGNESKLIDKDLYHVILKITVTVTANDKTIYLVEVEQAGIFVIQGFPQEALERILAAVCPNILFPYAREAISDLVTRGGFPQLLLAPVNFEGLYMQQKQQQAHKAAEELKAPGQTH